MDPLTIAGLIAGLGSSLFGGSKPPEYTPYKAYKPYTSNLLTQQQDVIARMLRGELSPTALNYMAKQRTNALSSLRERTGQRGTPTGVALGAESNFLQNNALNEAMASEGQVGQGLGYANSLDTLLSGENRYQYGAGQEEYQNQYKSQVGQNQYQNSFMQGIQDAISGLGSTMMGRGMENDWQKSNNSDFGDMLKNLMNSMYSGKTGSFGQSQNYGGMSGNYLKMLGL